jgi:hypothetical protein
LMAFTLTLPISMPFGMLMGLLISGTLVLPINSVIKMILV